MPSAQTMPSPSARRLIALFPAVVLPLSLFISALSSFPTAAYAAAIEAETFLRQYDDGRTKVTSPAVDVSGTFNKDTMKVSAGWVKDILTSSSSDVTTFSSKGTISENRTEFSGGFETLVPDGTLAIGYIQSDENDYHSKAISAGGTREFFQKNTVVSIGLSNGNDQINSSSDTSFDEFMKNQSYSLSLAQVLSRASLIQFIYDFKVENGYIASPYRRAKVIDPTSGSISSRAENHPRTRNRNAWAVKYNHFISAWNLSTATTYRLYQDSWGVLSHTIEERLTREFTRKWSASLTLRYYLQNQANFYSDYYIGDPGPFYTGNSTLANFSSYTIALRPVYTINDHISLIGRLEHYANSFKNATDAGVLTTLADDKKLEVSAFIIGLGLSAKF